MHPSIFYNYCSSATAQTVLALSLDEMNDNYTLDLFTHFLDQFIDSGLAVYSSETLILQTEQFAVNMFKNLNLHTYYNQYLPTGL